MKIVHIQSVVSTLYGVLDDQDNITSTHPTTSTFHRLDVQTMTELLNGLVTNKNLLAEQLDEVLRAQAAGETDKLEPDTEDATELEDVAVS